jgi:phosphoacetylglucosamine mutase
MYYNYGTSGFRLHHTDILNISKYIGHAVCNLSKKHSYSYGIMITASHNHHEDNGVKILTHDGYMISNYEEMYIETYVNDHFNKEIHEQTILENESISNKNNLKIHIGYDSRESSPKIFELIQEGCKECGLMVVNYGYVSTPEFHYILHTNSDSKTYSNHLKALIPFITSTSCTIDCANGIGSKVFESILIDEPICLKNIDWKIPAKLNTHCSSDFVCTYQKEPFEVKTNHELIQNIALGASLDGDADRSIFFSRNKANDFCLFDGDYMSALIVLYLDTLLKPVSECKSLNIGFIHTGYTNGACVKYIKTSYPYIHTICTATGIKHLHEEAEKYDIGIYFEQNGHGNVVFRPEIEETYNELKLIKQFFHPCIGDGIMNIFAILYILKELNMNADSWYNLYSKNHSILLKLDVKDKNIFKPTANELELVEPIALQKNISHYLELCVNTRSFVRPSGTENVVRIYVESESMFNMNKTTQNVLWQLLSKYHFHIFESRGEHFSISHIQMEDMNVQILNLLTQLTYVGVDPIESQNYLKNIYESLDQRHMIFVVKHDNVIIGCGTLLIEQKIIHELGSVGHIEDIVVDSKYRGYGIGKKIILHLNHLSKMMQCYKCILDCSNENVGFYEKCGFINKGVFMGSYL